MFGRWILAIAAIAMVTPSASWAGSMQFFEASAGPGITLESMSPPVGTVFNLQYDATTAEGGGILGFSVRVDVTGDLEIGIVATSNAPLLDTGLLTCLRDCGTAVKVFAAGPIFLTGGNVNGEGAPLFPGDPFLPGPIFGLLDITLLGGTNGDIILSSGGYSAVELFGGNVDITPFTLVRVFSPPVPEPGAMLLLGMGLGGLAFLRRRSR